MNKIIHKFKGRQFFRAINFIIVINFFYPVCSSDTLTEREQFLKTLNTLNKNKDFILSDLDLKHELAFMLKSWFGEKSALPGEAKYTLVSLDQGKQRKEIIPNRILDLDKEDLTEQSISTPITSDILPHVYGRIEARFKGMPPLCSTGIAINSYIILTRASAVSRLDRDCESIVFLAYSTKNDAYLESMNVQSIILPTKFFQDEKVMDIALLKLKDNIKFLRDINYNLLISAPPQVLPKTYAFFAFKEYRNFLEPYTISSIECDLDKESFFSCNADVPLGSGGAPLWVIENNYYYLVGTNAGKISQNQTDHKILKIDPTIIAEMINADRLYWQAMSNNKESQFLKTNV